jgi:hypothetical protein
MPFGVSSDLPQGHVQIQNLQEAFPLPQPKPMILTLSLPLNLKVHWKHKHYSYLPDSLVSHNVLDILDAQFVGISTIA